MQGQGGDGCRGVASEAGDAVSDRSGAATKRALWSPEGPWVFLSLQFGYGEEGTEMETRQEADLGGQIVPVIHIMMKPRTFSH